MSRIADEITHSASTVAKFANAEIQKALNQGHKLDDLIWCHIAAPGVGGNAHIEELRTKTGEVLSRILVRVTVQAGDEK